MTTSEVVVVGGRTRDIFVGQVECYNQNTAYQRFCFPERPQVRSEKYRRITE